MTRYDPPIVQDIVTLTKSNKRQTIYKNVSRGVPKRRMVAAWNETRLLKDSQYNSTYIRWTEVYPMCL